MFARIVLRTITPSAFKITKVARISKQYLNVVTYTPAPCILSTAITRRFYSQKPSEMSVDFETVQKATADNNILIVDVREPDEVTQHGKIPNSINIPLGNVTTALGAMSEKQFEQTYRRPKPTEETEIIFYCMIGKRSGMAQENAQKLGYKNVMNYLGSWNDWAAKTTKS